TRVPAPPKTAPYNSSGETLAHMRELERKVNDLGEFDNRRSMLRRLHDDSVNSFINSPGFGANRQILPSEKNLQIPPNSAKVPIPSPGTPGMVVSESEISTPGNVPTSLFREMHLDSVVDFVNVPGFGWILDRNKVAGFLPHRFSKAPQLNTWKVEVV